LRSFGDLVSKETNPELKKLKEKAEVKSKSKKDRRSKGDKIIAEDTGRDVINADIHEDVIYRPRQKETRVVYNQILNIVQSNFSDVPLDTLKAAVDEVLAILKTDDMKDVDRKNEIEVIIDKLTDQTFNTLTILAAKITDYDPEMKNDGDGEELLDVDIDINKEGEDSESSEDDVYAYDPANEEQKQNLAKAENEKDQEMSDDEGKILKVSEQDALWIQNQLQGFIKNQSKAQDMFEILNLEKPEDCANKILGLIKFYDSLKQTASLDISESEQAEKISKAKDELRQNIECKQIADGLEGDAEKLCLVFKRIIRKIKNKKDIELLDNEGYNIHDEQEIQLDFKEGARK
jgi:hypothetical protein